MVELKYFGGMTLDETAQILGISAVTVKRDWNIARAWLRAQLQ
ncbi:MAG: ECF-type sigma factor [Acidobacteriota bacterium]